MDALLWSINERLAGRQGIDLEPPSYDWVADIVECAVEETKDGANDDYDQDDRNFGAFPEYRPT